VVGNIVSLQDGNSRLHDGVVFPEKTWNKYTAWRNGEMEKE
jgi:hypothetical protein